MLPRKSALHPRYVKSPKYSSRTDTKTLQAPANYTLGSDPATLIKLKAVYDSLNEIDPDHTLKVKRGVFWDWIKDMFKAPGLKARSAVPTSVSLILAEIDSTNMRVLDTWKQ